MNWKKPQVKIFDGNSHTACVNSTATIKRLMATFRIILTFLDGYGYIGGWTQFDATFNMATNILLEVKPYKGWPLSEYQINDITYKLEQAIA